MFYKAIFVSFLSFILFNLIIPLALIVCIFHIICVIDANVESGSFCPGKPDELASSVSALSVSQTTWHFFVATPIFGVQSVGRGETVGCRLESSRWPIDDECVRRAHLPPWSPNWKRTRQNYASLMLVDTDLFSVHAIQRTRIIII